MVLQCYLSRVRSRPRVRRPRRAQRRPGPCAFRSDATPARETEPRPPHGPRSPPASPRLDLTLRPGTLELAGAGHQTIDLSRRQSVGVDRSLTHAGKVESLVRDSPPPLPEIARQLGADVLVEGAAAVTGERMRVSAKLVEAAGNRYLWAETYERGLGDLGMLHSIPSASPRCCTRTRRAPLCRGRSDPSERGSSRTPMRSHR